jgi:hypothetical protein
MTRDELLDLHENTCERCREVMKRKNQDYAGEDAGSPFANFRTAKAVGVDPAKGILMRMLDKMKRVQSYVERGDLKVKGEPVEDACDDLVNYSILLKGELIDRDE